MRALKAHMPIIALDVEANRLVLHADPGLYDVDYFVVFSVVCRKDRMPQPVFRMSVVMQTQKRCVLVDVARLASQDCELLPLHGISISMSESHVDHDLYAELIDQLVDRRKELGLSQRQVDQRIGCADGLVSKWECGIRTPKPRSFAEWAIALDGKIIFASVHRDKAQSGHDPLP